MKKKKSLLIASVYFLMPIFVSGCSTKVDVQPISLAPEPKPVPEVTVVEDLSHTINVPGETLSLIAKWYTGNPNNWIQLKAANPGIVPASLKIGQTIRIPSNLLTRRDSLTSDFIKKESASLLRLKSASKNTHTTTDSTVADQQGKPVLPKKEVLFGSNTSTYSSPDDAGATKEEIGSKAIKTIEEKDPNEKSSAEKNLSNPQEKNGEVDKEREKLLRELLSSK